MVVYIININYETTQKVGAYLRPFIDKTIDVYVYEELLSSYEWNSIKKALDDASGLTSTHFNIIKNFIVKNTGLVITPWADTHESILENPDKQKLVFCMCSHSPLKDGIHSPSSSDNCAHVASLNAKNTWNVWRPNTIIAITHASQPRFISIAQSFVDNLCDNTCSPNLEIVQSILECKKIITNGESTYALLILTQPELLEAIRIRQWLITHNTKVVFIGELTNELQNKLAQFSIPYAELHPYYDVFTAYCNTVNIDKIWPLRRQIVDIKPPVASSHWKRTGSVIILKEHHISTWDHYKKYNPKTIVNYYTHTGETSTIQIQDSTSWTDVEEYIGSFNGLFNMYPIYQKSKGDEAHNKFKYIVIFNEHEVTLPLLPQLKTGDFIEIPGTLEHAELLVSESKFIYANKIKMID
jgi:hypothetical protein